MYSQRENGPSRQAFKRALQKRKSALYPPDKPSRKVAQANIEAYLEDRIRRDRESLIYAQPTFGDNHGGDPQNTQTWTRALYAGNRLDSVNEVRLRRPLYNINS